MNCREAMEQFDRILFEEVQIDAGLLKHIDSCASCSRAYTDALKAREALDLVRRLDPVLRNPDEVTENIMSAIRREPLIITFVPLIFQRLLAAASVALFLLFGYEQYGVVMKVSALEMKISQTTTNSNYSVPQQLASAFNINNAGISFSGIGKLISRVNETTRLSFSSSKKQINQREIK